MFSVNWIPRKNSRFFQEKYTCQILVNANINLESLRHHWLPEPYFHLSASSTKNKLYVERHVLGLQQTNLASDAVYTRGTTSLCPSNSVIEATASLHACSDPKLRRRIHPIPTEWSYGDLTFTFPVPKLYNSICKRSDELGRVHFI